MPTEDMNFVHRYTYSQNRVSIDTMFVFGIYGNNASAWSKRYIYLQYDATQPRGCMDSEVQVTPNPYTYIWKYSYDADGNLARHLVR